MDADGELRRVTASSEPDLFWALRGGKENFGVVTSPESSLFPVERFYGGGRFFAGECAAEVVHAGREWVVGLPTEMTSSIAFLRRPASYERYDRLAAIKKRYDPRNRFRMNHNIEPILR